MLVYVSLRDVSLYLKIKEIFVSFKPASREVSIFFPYNYNLVIKLAL